VSSQAIVSACSRISSARSVISRELPIGVATIANPLRDFCPDGLSLFRIGSERFNLDNE
jgi:hypothetical protein